MRCRSRGRLDLSADGDASGGGAGQRLSASSRDGGDEYSSEASEYDTYGTVSAVCAGREADACEQSTICMRACLFCFER